MAEWESVAQLHSDEFSDLLRTGEALKRKFNLIIKKSPPTGDPKCPQYVRDALIARRLIIDKTEASDGGSDLDRSTDFDDTDDEEGVESGDDVESEDGDEYDADASPLFAEDEDVEGVDSHPVAQLAMAASSVLSESATDEIAQKVMEVDENAPVPRLPPLETTNPLPPKPDEKSAVDLSNDVTQPTSTSIPPQRISKLSSSSTKKRRIEKANKSYATAQVENGSSSDEVLGAKHLPTRKKKSRPSAKKTTKQPSQSSKRKKEGKKTLSTAFTTPVRKSKKGSDSSPSESSGYISSLRNTATTATSERPDDPFKSIMALMMMQTKNETEQKNRESETRKEEMRMHREEMGMQRQMMNMMMMTMMGSNHPGPRTATENSHGDGSAEDDRKPAAKTDKEMELEDGGAEC